MPPKTKENALTKDKKKIFCVLSDYDYAEVLAALKYENVKHIDDIIKHFIDGYLSGDEKARAVVEDYKEKNKIVGRSKKSYIIEQEKLAKKTTTLYTLKDEEIENIFDILDDTLE